MQGQIIFHGLHARLKHISVVVCISAGEDHITRFLVSSQANENVIRALKTGGFRIGTDLILKRQENQIPTPSFSPNALRPFFYYTSRHSD
jgi:hypothetical protein